MKIKYFTETIYNELYQGIEKNKDHYSADENNDWLADIIGGRKGCKESRLDIVLPSLNSEDDEYTNVIAIHSAFVDKITPKQASNPYLWAYLTHTVYWRYASERWIQNVDLSEKTIKQRFFCNTAEGNRIGFIRNAISRLWWIGYLSYQEEKKATNPYELTKLLTSHSDICQSIIERNFSMNKSITLGILSAIKEINDDKRLANVGVGKENGEYEWRDLCKYINRIGAVTLLDALTKDDIKELAYNYILSQRRS